VKESEESRVASRCNVTADLSSLNLETSVRSFTERTPAKMSLFFPDWSSKDSQTLAIREARAIVYTRLLSTFLKILETDAAT
jgi:hypothetical protein